MDDRPKKKRESFTITISLLLDAIIEGILDGLEVGFRLVTKLLGLNGEELLVLLALGGVDRVGLAGGPSVAGGVRLLVENRRVNFNFNAVVIVTDVGILVLVLLLLLLGLVDGFAARS